MLCRRLTRSFATGPLDPRRHAARIAAALAVACLLAPTSANARTCPGTLADYNPAKLATVPSIPIWRHTTPVEVETFGDWFLGSVVMQDAKSPGGRRVFTGIMSEVRYGGDLTGRRYAWMSYNTRTKSYQLTMLTPSSRVNFRKADFFTDGKKFRHYRYRRGNRIISGRRWISLGREHIDCNTFGDCTIGWAFTRDGLRRARRGWTLRLKTRSGRTDFEAAISLDGFTKAAERARQISRTRKRRTRAYATYKKKNYGEAIAGFRAAHQAGDLTAAMPYHLSRFQAYTFAPAQLTAAGFDSASYREVARAEAERDAQHAPAAMASVIYFLNTDTDFGPRNQPKIIRQLEYAAGFGSAFAARQLSRIHAGDGRYDLARAYASNARTLGDKQAATDRSLASSARRASRRCALRHAHRANTIASYENLIRWYPSTSAVVKARLTSLRKKRDEKNEVVRRVLAAKKAREQKAREAASARAQAAAALEARATGIWEVVKDSGDATLLRKFASDFPKSRHAGTANWLAEALEAKQSSGSIAKTVGQ